MSILKAGTVVDLSFFPLPPHLANNKVKIRLCLLDCVKLWLFSNDLLESLIYGDWGPRGVGLPESSIGNK